MAFRYSAGYNREAAVQSRVVIGMTPQIFGTYKFECEEDHWKIFLSRCEISSTSMTSRDDDQVGRRIVDGISAAQEGPMSIRYLLGGARMGSCDWRYESDLTATTVLVET